MTVIADILQTKSDNKTIELATARGELSIQIDKFIGHLNLMKQDDYHSLENFLTEVAAVIEKAQRVNIVAMQKDTVDALIVRID